MSTETTNKMLQLSMQQLLRERKFSAITVDDICRYAGVSRKTFYRYYPDRHALLTAVYNDCYFSNIEISDDDSFWDLFRKICKQISTDKPFFKHAFEVKDQNGFWDEAKALLTPLYMKEAPSYDFLNEIKLFFVLTDLDRLFQLIENWLHSDTDQSAEDFAEYIQISYYIYGLWSSQLAAGEERSTFSPEIYQDFEKHLKSRQ